MNDNELPLRLGISTCLLGENVRFDGGHKKDRYITDILGTYVEWVPVCPEVEIGMGTPREAVHLEGTVSSPKMVGIASGIDWTEKMHKFSATRIKQLTTLQLSGYLFKSDSPSCGVERVKVYTGKQSPNKNGRGIFASVFIQAFPLIPVEEEGRLHDAALRENFITRMFAYHRLQTLFAGFSRKALIRFHSEHKFLLLAHSPKHYTKLGQYVAKVATLSVKEFQHTYGTLFMEALTIPSTRKKHVNVLQHIFGFFSERLRSEEKSSILATIDDYYHGLVPLIVPITLIKHYVTTYNIEYISSQVYLTPHPKELMLLNHS